MVMMMVMVMVMVMVMIMTMMLVMMMMIARLIAVCCMFLYAKRLWDTAKAIHDLALRAWSQ
eukprot:9034626-Karenia_brevis.AAC.1